MVLVENNIIIKLHVAWSTEMREYVSVCACVPVHVCNLVNGVCVCVCVCACVYIRVCMCMP